MKFLKWLWKKWLAIARPIGNFQSQVILSIFYLLFLWPLAIVFKVFSDPFNLKAKRSNFSKWEHEGSIEDARRQY